MKNYINNNSEDYKAEIEREVARLNAEFERFVSSGLSVEAFEMAQEMEEFEAQIRKKAEKDAIIAQKEFEKNFGRSPIEAEFKSEEKKENEVNIEDETKHITSKGIDLDDILGNLATHKIERNVHSNETSSEQISDPKIDDFMKKLSEKKKDDFMTLLGF